MGHLRFSTYSCNNNTIDVIAYRPVFVEFKIIIEFTYFEKKHIEDYIDFINELLRLYQLEK